VLKHRWPAAERGCRPVKVIWRILLPVLIATTAFAVFAMRSGKGISVTYSPSLDAICSVVRGPRIREEWQTELLSRLQEYRELWNSVGPRLLAGAEAITGIPQPAAAMVRLTLCNVPSQSIFGISVNMRFALKSYSTAPVPLRYKVDTQFHELLHRMLRGYIPVQSPLMMSHSNESECVRDHLHLLALQKAVLLRQDDGAALADVLRVDNSLPSGCYRRAWEIVNASESVYQSYISEIGK
jgi:hypothetical protein